MEYQSTSNAKDAAGSNLATIKQPASAHPRANQTHQNQPPSPRGRRRPRGGSGGRRGGPWEFLDTASYFLSADLWSSWMVLRVSSVK
jgi:hypothetical protein